MRTLRIAREGMSILKDGDPKKHQKKVRALGRDDEVIYVPAEEGAMEDDENYLNLEKLDGIVESPHEERLMPFSRFRDMVRTVEAGPDSEDPYRQIQEVNTDEGKAPVRREKQPDYGSGAYQLDFATAKTAYNRIKQIADKRDMDYPKLTEEELKYPAELDPELQDMLFTAHFAMDKNTSVKDVLTDSGKWGENWYTGHYKGDDPGRLEHFYSVQGSQMQ